MTNFRMMITADGKHPASKWADLAADEIIDISAQAEETRMREAQVFRAKLVDIMTVHHQKMMDHEQEEIKAGRHAEDLPYDTEEYAATVVKEICSLAKGFSFEKHFRKPQTIAYIEAVCNRNFKSAKLVERSHYHSSRASQLPASPPKKAKK